jgi:ankyrin repeat protein
MSTTTGPCCDLLIEKGANVDLPNKNGDTPKDIAFMNGNLEVLKAFGVEIKDVINKPDKYGKTMLEYAVSKNTNREQAQIKIIQLINHGANTDKYDSEGNTLNDLAFKNFNRGIFAALKNFPTNINDRNKEGKAMIHYAAAEKDPIYAKIKMKGILASAPDIDITDEEGKTPLMYAVTSKNINVITLLLENGAKPDIENFKGKTAYDIAKEQGGDNSAVLELLRKSIENPSKSAESARASTFTTAAIGGPGR